MATRLLPVFKNGDVGSRRGYLVKQGCVDVQRKYARKVYNNAGGATVKTVISGLELITKHINRCMVFASGKLRSEVRV